VNSRLNIKREVVLGSGLFAALIAGGLLVSCRNRETNTPAPENASTVQSRAIEHPAQRINQKRPAPQPADAAPDIMRVINPVINESGYEAPFSSTNAVSLNTPTDPAQLREALAAAVASGNIRSLAVLLHSGNPAGEIEAVRALTQIGGGEALASALGKILTVSPDSPDYKKFINAFANCRSAAVAEWLTGFLGQTQTEDVRQRVLTILAALRGPEVVDSLVASLANPLDTMHAKDCAELLAKSSDPEQAAILKDLIETGKTTAIQTAAARGLANVGSGEACSTLIEAGSSTDATALACRDALASVKSSYGQEVLLLAAGNPSVPAAVRCAAIQALETQPGERTRIVLVNLAQATSDPALQSVIKQTLQTIEQRGTPPPSGSALGNAAKSGEIWF
jgi:hypothetical protein